MLIISFFQWWYTNGWTDRFKNIGERLSKQSESFSIGIILKTLFKPWKQITSLSGGSGFGGFINRLIDGLVSRFVGFGVRVIVLFAGTVIIVFSLIINTVLAIIWPVLPAMPLILLIYSLGSL